MWLKVGHLCSGGTVPARRDRGKAAGRAAGQGQADAAPVESSAAGRALPRLLPATSGVSTLPALRPPDPRPLPSGSRGSPGQGAPEAQAAGLQAEGARPSGGSALGGPALTSWGLGFGASLRGPGRTLGRHSPRAAGPPPPLCLVPYTRPPPTHGPRRTVTSASAAQVRLARAALPREASPWAGRALSGAAGGRPRRGRS